jgi:putative transposase
MKRSKFSEAQIAFVMRQAEEGTSVEEVCRKTGISQATFYAWKKKYGGLLPSEMKRLRQLEEENGRLKRIVADLSLDKEMLQDVIKRKLYGSMSVSAWSSHSEPRRPLEARDTALARKIDNIFGPQSR